MFLKYLQMASLQMLDFFSVLHILIETAYKNYITKLSIK